LFSTILPRLEAAHAHAAVAEQSYSSAAAIAPPFGGLRGPVPPRISLALLLQINRRIAEIKHLLGFVSQ
jgi:hypothetical protein